MSKWKEGQAPVYVWLSKKDIGAKKRGKCFTRLCLGSIKCWTMEPLHEPGKWVCYRLVPNIKGKNK